MIARKYLRSSYRLSTPDASASLPMKGSSPMPAGCQRSLTSGVDSASRVQTPNPHPARRVNEKSPAHTVPGLFVGLLSTVQHTEQPHDLGVEPHQRHGQAKGDAPRGLLRRACADRLIGLVEVDQEAERRQADADQREDDRDRTAAAKRSKLPAAAEHIH